MQSTYCIVLVRLSHAQAVYDGGCNKSRIIINMADSVVLVWSARGQAVFRGAVTWSQMCVPWIHHLLFRNTVKHFEDAGLTTGGKDVPAPSRQDPRGRVRRSNIWTRA